MRLLALADIHGCLEHVESIASEIRACDGLVIAGDITDFGGFPDALRVLSMLQVSSKPSFAVRGNCDLPGVDELLRQSKVNLHGVCIEFGGFRFVGVGGSLPCPGVTPNEADENDFRKTLEKAMVWQHGQAQLDRATPDNLVLVTHQPAWGTQLDITGSGRHTGSRAVREFIERYQPILAISGHMHEAYGTDKIGKTVLVNPGPFRQGRYAVVEINDRQVQSRLYP